MNLLDIVFILLLAGSIFRGVQRGLVMQAASLFGLLIGIWVAFQFTNDLAVVFSEWWSLPDSTKEGWLALLPVEKAVYSIVAFLVLLFGTKFAITIVSNLLNQVASLPVLSLLNRTGGALLAVISFVLFSVVIINVLHIMPWETGQQAVRDSSIAQGLLAITPNLKETFMSVFTKVYEGK
ncbi:CvpA family protein [Hazenella coriacea]|uniref:Putative membrane protein required for colicin V production n=1 Tax=Hazenella coriacea TaxID=1179467 RepID=A0A4V2UVQ1_9BACL|nr:CvpA family protein [Hazenella coriacea]TCS96687.1 putative membrane protein required for colicin V production [Hazenella coriacea]